MNKSYGWWLLHPRQWPLLIQRNRLREALGLRLIPWLSKAEQSGDNSAPTKKIVQVVHALERQEVIGDDDAQQLWDQARHDPAIQQLADDLHRVSCGSTLPISNLLSAKSLRRLRKDTLKSIEFETLSIAPHLPVLIPLVSAFFLFSGFIHVAIFFSSFDLPFSRYFGLSDYIAASMDSLMAVILSTLLAIVMMSMTRKVQRLNALQRQLLVANWGTVFGIVMMLIALVILGSSSTSDELRTMVIYALMITVGTSVAPFISAYAKRPNATLLFSLFIVIYSALLWLMSNTELQALDKSGNSNTQIILNDDSGTVLTQRIIAGNSLYLFLLNDRREITVLPIENIKQIYYINNTKDAGNINRQ